LVVRLVLIAFTALRTMFRVGRIDIFVLVKHASLLCQSKDNALKVFDIQTTYFVGAGFTEQVKTLNPFFSVQICRPGVNFTNILWAAFAPKYFCQKNTNPNCRHIKAAQKTFIPKSCSSKISEIDTGPPVLWVHRHDPASCFVWAHFQPYRFVEVDFL